MRTHQRTVLLLLYVLFSHKYNRILLLLLLLFCNNSLFFKHGVRYGIDNNNILYSAQTVRRNFNNNTNNSIDKYNRLDNVKR